MFMSPNQTSPTSQEQISQSSSVSNIVNQRWASRNRSIDDTSRPGNMTQSANAATNTNTKSQEIQRGHDHADGKEQASSDDDGEDDGDHPRTARGRRMFEQQRYVLPRPMSIEYHGTQSACSTPPVLAAEGQAVSDEAVHESSGQRHDGHHDHIASTPESAHGQRKQTGTPQMHGERRRSRISSITRRRSQSLDSSRVLGGSPTTSSTVHGHIQTGTDAHKHGAAASRDPPQSPTRAGPSAGGIHAHLLHHAEGGVAGQQGQPSGTRSRASSIIHKLFFHRSDSADDEGHPSLGLPPGSHEGHGRIWQSSATPAHHHAHADGDHALGSGSMRSSREGDQELDDETASHGKSHSTNMSRTSSHGFLSIFSSHHNHGHSGSGSHGHGSQSHTPMQRDGSVGNLQSMSGDQEHEAVFVDDDGQKQVVKIIHFPGSSVRDHYVSNSAASAKSGKHESLFTKLFHGHHHHRRGTGSSAGGSSVSGWAGGTGDEDGHDTDAGPHGTASPRSRRSSRPSSPILKPLDISHRGLVPPLDNANLQQPGGHFAPVSPLQQKESPIPSPLSNEVVAGIPGDDADACPRPIKAKTASRSNLSQHSMSDMGSPRSPRDDSVSQSRLNAASVTSNQGTSAASGDAQPHMPSSSSTFGFLKQRKPRERSETEGSHSILKELRSSITHHRRGHSSSVVGRDDHHHDGSASMPAKGMNRSGSEVGLSEKYGRPDEVLGKGANATVRLAHSKEKTEKLYAIKEFRKRRKDETEKEYIKKVIAEFCISSSMHHENVVHTVDLIRDEHGRWCEVMEYCAGGDLFQKTSTVGFTSDEEMYCLFRQLLNGVGYMHSIGVAHRDLKPENILLSAGGRTLKITDFGTSAVFRTQWEKEPHKLHGVCGSAPYIAPEEWDEQHEYFPTKVDVWACGMIFYAMLSKSLLWTMAKKSEDHYATYLRKRETGYPQFERYTDGPRRILYNCLDPDPIRRLEIAQTIEDPWVSTIDYCRSVGKGSGGSGSEMNQVGHVHTTQSSSHR
ncbi:hypothetical protein BC831DRAFT_426876 [Entophlyctis helioformis]|nr:hypothetical protein BC831DRAFT_426876 [Entophlyctis helioformis]